MLKDDKERYKNIKERAKTLVFLIKERAKDDIFVIKYRAKQLKYEIQIQDTTTSSP